MGRGFFLVCWQPFFPANPPRKESLVTTFRESPIVRVRATRRMCLLRTVGFCAQIAQRILGERLDSRGKLVHATNVGKITALDLQDEDLSGQDGWLAHVKVGLILIIIGFGDWDGDDYDRIIDHYEDAGYVIGGQGVDWWDHASSSTHDVFVLRLEKK